LGGCGTTAKQASDISNYDDPTRTDAVAELTQKLVITQMQLVNNPEPEQDYITCTDFNVAEPGALIEVYSSAYLTAENLQGTANANANGYFIVDITNTQDGLDNQVFYVTQTSQGKRRSEAVVITK